MATWQFDSFLIPRARITESFGRVPSYLSDEAFEETDWWGGLQLPADYQPQLEQIFQPSRSWSPNIELWGDEDSNCVEVYRSETSIDSVCWRLDLRRPAGIVYPMLDFTVFADCLLVASESCAIVEPTAPELQNAIINSSAHRFVSDPVLFLNKLRHSSQLDHS